MAMALIFWSRQRGFQCRGEGGVVQEMFWLQERGQKWSESISTDREIIKLNFCHQVFDEMSA